MSSIRLFSRQFPLMLALLGSCYLTTPTPAIAAGETEETYELLNLFGDVFERVRRDYVEEVSDKKLIEAAINGMLTSLDPHSGYLNEKHFQEMQVQTKGEFGGLGIEVTMENGLVKVVSPIDDTPAFKAGIQAGDFISQIDGEQVMGMALSEAVEKMRGPVGTDIKITVLRESEKEPIEMTMTRDLIKIKSVRFHMEDDIGYVRITSFSEHTNPSLKYALEQLNKENPAMKGIVLDLRNNPGGLLDQAILVTDTFLEKGEIVSTRERDPNNSQRFSATEGDLLNGRPIVVLINQGSASASEIVAGALKDHRRAIVMGTKSFGKGSVQTVIPLKKHGAMRLTTSRYYTPSGTSIQAKGIVPDIEVTAARIENLESDKVRTEADLRGRLTNDQDRHEKNQVKPLLDKNKKPLDKKDAEAEERKKDYQLARALDLLRGLAIYQQVEGSPVPVTPIVPTK
jgi:carboxyl-terminal processing protease